MERFNYLALSKTESICWHKIGQQIEFFQWLIEFYSWDQWRKVLIMYTDIFIPWSFYRDLNTRICLQQTSPFPSSRIYSEFWFDAKIAPAFSLHSFIYCRMQHKWSLMEPTPLNVIGCFALEEFLTENHNLKWERRENGGKKDDSCIKNGIIKNLFFFFVAFFCFCSLKKMGFQWNSKISQIFFKKWLPSIIFFFLSFF